MPGLRNSNFFKDKRSDSIPQNFSVFKPNVLWVRQEGQDDQNSASLLGSEVLQGTVSRVVTLPKNPLKALAMLPSFLVAKDQIYYQFGPPHSNLVICAMIIARKKVVAHYLDNIIGGYPKWATRLGVHLPIVFILRHCSLLLVISPAMSDYVAKHYKVSTPILVRYRTGADGSTGRPRKPIHENRVVFIGSISDKTNSEALLDAANRLADAGFSLDVYTDCIPPFFKSRILSNNIRFLGPIHAEQVISITQTYAAHLLPFNSDDRSYAFYGLSTPSKLPNVLVAGRPVVYHGPDAFWLYGWLKSRSGLCYRVCELTGVAIGGIGYSDKEIEANYTAFRSIGAGE